MITLDDNTTCTQIQVKLKYCAVLITRGVVHQFFAYLTEDNWPFKTSDEKFHWEAMHTCVKMKEYSAQCNLVVWVTSHILGTTHEELFARYVQHLEVKISSWQLLCSWTGQLPTAWLARMANLMHHFRSSHPNTNSWAPYSPALAGHRGTLYFGLVSPGLNTACVSCMSLRSYYSPRLPDLSTTRKLSHSNICNSEPGKLPWCYFLLYTTYFCSTETSSGQRWEASTIFWPFSSSLNQ